MKRTKMYSLLLVVMLVFTLSGSALAQTSKLSSGQAWGLTGNTGTDPAVNALGTLDSQPLVIKTGGVEAMRVDPTGRVGVGTTSPQGRLHANGDDIGLFVDQSNVFGVLVNSAGSDGIRVNSAAFNGLVVAGAGQNALHVAATQSGLFVEQADFGVLVNSAGSDGVRVNSSNFNGVVVADAGQDALYVGADRYGLHVEQAGQDGVHVASANQDGVHVASASQDGIHVESAGRYAGYFNGTVSTKILEITGGSDVAEPFEVMHDEPVEPGTVVAIDPAHIGQLRVADSAYDRTVAGIVSGANGVEPGLILRQEGTAADGPVPVALSGRVYVRVDADYGAVQPGDLLTTSDTPGHAMKVAEYERAQGAILGKAMSSLDAGQGLVLVLVSLQ